MISQIGENFLMVAVFFSLLQCVLPIYGFYKNNKFFLAFARPSAYLQFVAILGSYLCLTYAFVTNDFSIGYVAANSHPQLPLLYRYTALWGAHEGSILLWCLILSLWTCSYCLLNNFSRLMSLTIAILGLCSVCFLSFLFFTSNPFILVSNVSTGFDLNPLLQDIGFVFHPPILYLGYVGFATSFAITLAALIDNKLNSDWARITKNFALAAWIFLTCGIMLGSWWAYRVLGWGGFWFWDPVENASLLPWIAGISLIHILILVEKRESAINWAVILALTCFLLSMLGTFLVRSGVLISAHTFASDPKRGVLLLIFLGLFSFIATAFYLRRANKFPSKKLSLLFNRETFLLINSIMLFIAMLTILLGTIYPLLLDALHLGLISIGAPYFNQVMQPLLLLLLILMSVGVTCRWSHDNFKRVAKLYLQNLIISLLIGICVLYAFSYWDLSLLVILTLSILVIVSVAKKAKFALPLTLSHSGFAITIIGILLTSTLSIEKQISISPGDAAHVGPYQVFFISTQGISGSNYRGISAQFEILKHAHHIIDLFPEKRIYTVRDMVMTKVAIHPGLFRDIYIALGEPLTGNAWSVRIYYKPFIRFIWLGGLLMAMGGLLAFRKKEYVG